MKSFKDIFPRVASFLAATFGEGKTNVEMSDGNITLPEAAFASINAELEAREANEKQLNEQLAALQKQVKAATEAKERAEATLATEKEAYQKVIANLPAAQSLNPDAPGDDADKTFKLNKSYAHNQFLDEALNS